MLQIRKLRIFRDFAMTCSLHSCNTEQKDNIPKVYKPLKDDNSSHNWYQKRNLCRSEKFL